MSTTITEPVPNIELLDKIYEIVKAQAAKAAAGEHSRWDQGAWVDAILEPTLHEDGVYADVRCGTSFCFAGWVAAETKAAFVTDYTVLADPSVDTDRVHPIYGGRSVGRYEVYDEAKEQWVEVAVETVPIAVRAQTLLGITDNEAALLFHGGNDLDLIQEVINQIKARAADQNGESA